VLESVLVAQLMGLRAVVPKANTYNHEGIATQARGRGEGSDGCPVEALEVPHSRSQPERTQFGGHCGLLESLEAGLVQDVVDDR
jgi:hypothetical protein